MSAILHGIVGSPYMWAAILGFEEKGASYEISAMDFGDQKKPAYLELQPFGRIPVLDHDGFQLYETQAILRYVDAVFPGAKLQPDEPRQAARMNQLIGIADWYFFPQVTATICFNRLVAPHLGMPVNEEAITAAIPNARNCLRAVARIAAEGGEFLVSDSPTIADIMLTPHLTYLSFTPEGREVLGDFPGLTAWIERMGKRPSVQKSTPNRG